MVIYIACDTSELIIPAKNFQPPNDVRKYFPLDTAMRWTYRLSQWTDMGLSESTLVIRRARNVQSHQGSVSAEVIDEGVDTNFTYSEAAYWTIDSSTYRRFPDAAPGLYIPLTFCEAPIVSGHTWPVSQNDTGYDSWYGRELFTSVDTTVYIQGRKYEHCLMIDPDFTSDQMFWWHFVVAPGIGIVREDFSMGLGGGSLELIGRNF